MPARLSKEEAHAYLDSKPGWIVLTTIGADGFPHSIPIGYFRMGDDIYIGCRTGTQKLKNIERNPKVSVMVNDGSTMADIRGVMVQGTATIITAPEEFLSLSREAARQRGVPTDQLPTEARPGAAYIKVVPKRSISWDYSRER